MADKAALAGLTISELIENFIADLVDGTRTNGSDERMYAEQWYKRCWLGMFPSPTIHGFCALGQMDSEDILKRFDKIDDLQKEVNEIEKKQAEETDETELSYLKDNLKWAEERLQEAEEDIEQFWHNNYLEWTKRAGSIAEVGTLEEEFEKLRQWLKDYKEFMDEE